MKNEIKSMTVAMVGMALMQVVSLAAEQSEIKDPKEKLSYSVGMNIGNNLKRSGFDVDVDVLAAANKDVLAGKELKLTDQQARDALGAYQKELQTKRDEERKKTAEKNKKEGEAFLTEKKKKQSVK